MYCTHSVIQTYSAATCSYFLIIFTEHFLHKQTDLIKTMSDHITNLRRVGLGLGEYQFDKETME